MKATKTTAVVAPQPEELAPFLRLVPETRPVPHPGPGRFFAGELISRRLVLGWTGDGPRAAREGLETLIGQHDVARLLVLGVAGGLTAGLAFGQLVVAREVRDAGGLAPAPDPAWIERAMKLPGMREAIVYSHDRILASAADKDALGRRLLDESEVRVGAATVDLETATYARTAAEHGIPYTAIRAVSDAVEEDLPVDFNRFRDPGGGVRRGRVALHALVRPWLIGSLLRLRLRVRECGERLGNAAVFTLLADPKTTIATGLAGPFMVNAG